MYLGTLTPTSHACTHDICLQVLSLEISIICRVSVEDLNIDAATLYKSQNFSEAYFAYRALFDRLGRQAVAVCLIVELTVNLLG